MSNQRTSSRPSIQWGRMIGGGVKVAVAIVAGVAALGFLSFAVPAFAGEMWNTQFKGNGLPEGVSAIAPELAPKVEEYAMWAWNEGTGMLEVSYNATSEFFTELFNPNTNHEWAKPVRDFLTNPTTHLVAAGTAAAAGAYALGSWAMRVRGNESHTANRQPGNNMGSHEYAELRRRLHHAMSQERG